MKKQPKRKPKSRQPSIKQTAVRPEKSTSFSVTSYAVFWSGIMGAALTLFGNLQAVFDLADWARYICAVWIDSANWAVALVASALGQKFIPEVVPPLLFTYSLLLTAIGGLMLEGKSGEHPYADFSPKKTIKDRIYWFADDFFPRMFVGISTAVVALALYVFVTDRLVLDQSAESIWNNLPGGVTAYLILAAICVPLAVQHRGLKNYGWGIVSGILLGVLLSILTLQSARKSVVGGTEAISRFRSIGMKTSLHILPLKISIYSIMAAPFFIVCRLALVLVVLSLLMFLNWLSTSGWTAKAPTIPG